MAPRVLHLSTYDANGGAAHAAHNLHRAMVDSGMDSQMVVARKGTGDPTVAEHGPRQRFLIASELDRRLWALERSPLTTWRSPARFGSLSATAINRMPVDIVNLHWVTDGFLSVETIGSIGKPVVWSMYDMWPFTGTEHYIPVGFPDRWTPGYTRANRPRNEHGVDLDRMTFNRKRRAWRTPMHMVPASSWLAHATGSSTLMRDWPITRIPHVIDTDMFRPMDRTVARTALGLPHDRPLLLFLASAGITDQRKGWDLLEPAVKAVRQHHPNLEVIVAGPPSPEHRPFPIHWMGPLSDQQTVATLYGACDVTAVPSREDNLPLTALEAHACGRAVIAFSIGGLPDIVEHQASGYLAQPFDTGELAAGLRQALDDSLGLDVWGVTARARAMAGWSPGAVVSRYRTLYDTVLEVERGR